MTNAELAEYLNAELELSGSVAVTANVLRQWVLWDLLPKATGRGLGRGQGLRWGRSERDLRRARLLARWRAGGVRRENALIVHAYVAWGYRDWERVRSALAAELEVSTAAIRKRVVTDLQFSSYRDLGETRKRAFRTQLGPLDHRFKDTPFELSAELYTSAAQAMFHPESASSKLPELLNAAITNMLPFVQVSSDPFHTAISAQYGLFALADETNKSVIDAIKQCTKTDLRRARALLYKVGRSRRFDWSTRPIPDRINQLSQILDSLGPEITTGHWLTTNLALAVRLYQSEAIGPEMVSFNPELLTGLRPGSL